MVKSSKDIQPDDILEVFGSIEQHVAWNPECANCSKDQTHCGECLNPVCQTCTDLDMFCGYCNFEKYIDHAAHCDHLIHKWGIEDKYEVVVADNFHLQIDCDNMDDVKYCLKQMKILSHAVSIEGYKITKSKSGNRHVIIKLTNPYAQWERIAMQACLGSDRVREILNFVACAMNHKDSILLIESIRTKDEPWVKP